jgi:predicted metal-dependent phosphoesterase TrpH
MRCFITSLRKQEIKMLYDLHVHTTASDGVETPAHVIAMAIEKGLAGIAITDHDTVDGIEPALDFINCKGITIDFIPGIELNTDFGDDELHILGYYIDYKNEMLINRIKEISNLRYQRAQKMVSKLNTFGIQISFSHVQELAKGDIIGRPHIARALVQSGYVLSEKEAFDKYIERGKPCYVPRYKLTPAEAIEIVKQAGGISVLAHPGLINDSRKITQVIGMGIEGLEIYYPEHSIIQIQDLTQLAQKHNLLTTGGSDFHGHGSSENRNSLGLTGINENIFDQISEYHRTHNKKY